MKIFTICISIWVGILIGILFCSIVFYLSDKSRNRYLDIYIRNIKRECKLSKIRIIDEFVKRLEEGDRKNKNDFKEYGIIWDNTDLIAEELKEGIYNETIR